jgi:acetyl-CoA acetyltransferase
MSGVAAVDLYENRLADAATALSVLADLHRHGLSTLAVRERMARVAAYAELSNFHRDNALPDPTVSGFSVAGPTALRRAGMTPRDVRMLQAYDDFLIAILLQLEDIGFCPKGKGAEFILATDLTRNGSLPINTGGGQISCGQPSLAGGGINLTEGVRQILGQAGARQVSDPRNAMITGIGVIPYTGNWSTSAALILEALE